MEIIKCDDELYKEVNNFIKKIHEVTEKHGCDWNTDIAIVKIIQDVFASVADNINDFNHEFDVTNKYLKYAEYGVPIKSEKEFDELIKNIVNVFKSAAEIICKNGYDNDYYKILDKIERHYKCAKELEDDSIDPYIDDLGEIIEKMKNINLNDKNCTEEVKYLFGEIGKMLPKLWI